jgi:hypothetical protein
MSVYLSRDVESQNLRLRLALAFVHDKLIVGGYCHADKTSKEAGWLRSKSSLHCLSDELYTRK